ncbi:MAG: ECF-type sigma factor [Lysobacteraceae bacterium]|nr:sigma-70 family RNA polymerase sigma factor [Xanthomonadales bacterium]HPF72756.1 ECF-type sigma factor [Xanthomonadaceae bacterium]HRX99732.1 ECF-type sigma factor [Xanthomonadaceae bacterium]
MTLSVDINAMTDANDTDVTGLLARWGEDAQAREQLVAMLYAELRRLARGLLSGSGEQTLQPTALVNEAFLKLLGADADSFDNRRHFFGAAARAMRQVLVDRARRRHSDKRGSGVRPLSLDHALGIPVADDAELLVLDDALRRLELLDPQAARVVELRYFGGLTLEQTAEVVGIHTSTVSAEWAHARAWLRQHMSDPA